MEDLKDLLTDDLYAYRKYGAKGPTQTRNSTRHYFKCNHDGCSARKIVEVSNDDGSVKVEMMHQHNHPPDQSRGASKRKFANVDMESPAPGGLPSSMAPSQEPGHSEQTKSKRATARNVANVVQLLKNNGSGYPEDRSRSPSPSAARDPAPLATNLTPPSPAMASTSLVLDLPNSAPLHAGPPGMQDLRPPRGRSPATLMAYDTAAPQMQWPQQQAHPQPGGLMAPPPQQPPAATMPPGMAAAGPAPGPAPGVATGQLGYAGGAPGAAGVAMGGMAAPAAPAPAVHGLVFRGHEGVRLGDARIRVTDWQEADGTLALLFNGTDKEYQDDYTWRKYGKKEIKGRAVSCPRFYWRCTVKNCDIKRHTQATLDGCTEIHYYGRHNHGVPAEKGAMRGRRTAAAALGPMPLGPDTLPLAPATLRGLRIPETAAAEWPSAPEVVPLGGMERRGNSKPVAAPGAQPMVSPCASSHSHASQESGHRGGNIPSENGGLPMGQSDELSRDDLDAGFGERVSNASALGNSSRCPLFFLACVAAKEPWL